MHEQEQVNIKAALFDFGGVLAEDGVKKAFRSVAPLIGLESEAFVDIGIQKLFETNLLEGKSDERVFWNEIDAYLQKKITSEELRGQVLKGFILRGWLMDMLKEIKARGVVTGILSDQWVLLDELDKRDNFFSCFDYVFNSYYTGITKKDLKAFSLALDKIQIPPEEVLFVDDHLPNIRRSESIGMHGIHYQNRDQTTREMIRYFPYLDR